MRQIGIGTGAQPRLRRAGLAVGCALVLSVVAVGPAQAFVYWAVPGPFGTIGRASLDGTGANDGFITGLSFPEGVAVDAGHLYWSDTPTIGRANLDSTGVNYGFVTGAGSPGGVAVDAGHVYWANENNGQGAPRSGGRTSTGPARTETSSPTRQTP